MEVESVTHDVLAGACADRCEHLPDAVDKAAELGEGVRVLLGKELGNLTDRGANLLERARCVVVVLHVSFGISSTTHASLELWTLPAEVLQEPSRLVALAHELRHVVLDERGKVLACEVVEDLDEEKEGLSQEGKRSIRREGLASRGRQELVDVLEELEVGLAEAVKDKVDLREELVGAELGAPAGLLAGSSNS